MSSGSRGDAEHVSNLYSDGFSRSLLDISWYLEDIVGLSLFTFCSDFISLYLAFPKGLLCMGKSQLMFYHHPSEVATEVHSESLSSGLQHFDSRSSIGKSATQDQFLYPF